MSYQQFRSRIAWGLWLLGLALFVAGNSTRPPAQESPEELSVALSVPAQLLLHAGDRFMAANAAIWRAIVVDTTILPKEALKVLARIQVDASWLNPAHEDNYYIAAAILPWEGQVASAQIVLQRATDARRNDYLPPFFYGFNQLQFFGDAAGASAAALIGAEHAQDPGDRQLLTVIGAKWLERTDDADAAQRVVLALAQGTSDRALKQHLLQRSERLRGLGVLRDAARSYERDQGRKLERLEDLVQAGYLAKLPQDPVGSGYDIANNWPVLRSAEGSDGQ